MMDLSIPYYEDNSRLSNSAIGWFLNGGPWYFYQKLTGKLPDETGAALSRGTRIHEYILQPEEFDKDYVVFTGKTPVSAQQIAFCERYASSVEIEPEKRVLDAYKHAYSIVGKSEQKMLSDGLKMVEEYASYIESMEDKREKLTSYQMEHLNKILYAFSNHKAANELVSYGDTTPMGWEEHHEFHINWSYCIDGRIGTGVDCKSLLDCVKFNFEKKICQIIDLKTTTKLWHFEDSMKQYDYLRQLCFYTMAVKWYLVNERGVDEDEVYGNNKKWKFEYFIIAIDGISKTPEVRTFRIDSKTVYSRHDDIVNVINRVWWHKYEDLWEHSKEYYTGDGTETLELKANE